MIDYYWNSLVENNWKCEYKKEVILIIEKTPNNPT